MACILHRFMSLFTYGMIINPEILRVEKATVGLGSLAYSL